MNINASSLYDLRTHVLKCPSPFRKTVDQKLICQARIQYCFLQLNFKANLEQI